MHSGRVRKKSLLQCAGAGSGFHSAQVLGSACKPGDPLSERKPMGTRSGSSSSPAPTTLRSTSCSWWRRSRSASRTKIAMILGSRTGRRLRGSDGQKRPLQARSTAEGRKTVVQPDQRIAQQHSHGAQCLTHPLMLSDLTPAPRGAVSLPLPGAGWPVGRLAGWPVNTLSVTGRTLSKFRCPSSALFSCGCVDRLAIRRLGYVPARDAIEGSRGHGCRWN